MIQIPENNKREVKENFFATLSNNWFNVFSFILVWWLFSLALKKLFPIDYIYCVLMVLFICVVTTLLRISTTLSLDYEAFVDEYEQEYQDLVKSNEILLADNEILKTNFETIRTDLESYVAWYKEQKANNEQLQTQLNEVQSKISDIETGYEDVIADLQQELKAKSEVLSKLQQDNLANLPKLKQWEKLKDFYFLVECEIEPITVMNWKSFLNTINPKKQRLLDSGVDLSFLP
jgi:hypothetical protein